MLKRVTIYTLVIALIIGLAGCGLQDDDQLSSFDVSGIVRGVINGGRVEVGNQSGEIDLDGLYTVKDLDAGEYTLKVFDHNNQELFSELIVVKDSLIKDVTIDSIRLTYWRPVNDMNVTRELIDNLAQFGVTDLYVETFFHGMTIYPSSYATQKSFADDYFEELITYAHTKNIRVHAWVEALYWYNLKFIGDPPAGHILDGTDQITLDDQIYTINKKIVTADQNGTIVIEGGKVFASPFAPEVVELITNIASEIDVKYNVDGISLDYIRFPAGDSAFGYGDSSPYQTGMTEEELHELRVEAVRNLVGAVADSIDLETIFSASVFPGYYTDGGSEYNKSQDWKSWIEETEIDWMLPMCYDYALESISADLQLSLDAQVGTVTLIPVLAINPGHDDIDTQYDQVYSHFDFAGYGIWKADYIDQLLP